MPYRQMIPQTELDYKGLSLVKPRTLDNPLAVLLFQVVIVQHYSTRLGIHILEDLLRPKAQKLNKYFGIIWEDFQPDIMWKNRMNITYAS